MGGASEDPPWGLGEASACCGFSGEGVSSALATLATTSSGTGVFQFSSCTRSW